MINFQQVLSIINPSECITVIDTKGKILLDSQGDPLYDVINNKSFDLLFYQDNWNREVNDITVVKQDLSNDPTTLLIQLL